MNHRYTKIRTRFFRKEVYDSELGMWVFLSALSVDDRSSVDQSTKSISQSVNEQTHIEESRYESMTYQNNDVECFDDFDGGCMGGFDD